LKKFASAEGRSLALTGVKLMAVVLLLYAAPKAWTSLFEYEFGKFLNTHRLLYALGYAVIFWATIASLIIVPFLRNTYVRIPLVALITIGCAADQIYFHVTDYHLNLTSLRIIWAERNTGLDALSTYMIYFARDCLWVIGAGTVMGLAPRQGGLKLRWSSIPLSVLALISTVITYTRGATESFPPPFALPVMFGIVAGSNEIAARTPQLVDGGTEIEYGGAIKPSARHIVLMVDESVRGDFLEINQSEMDNTPFLVSQKDRLINFGVAVAGSNCSRPARTMIRFGMQRDDFGESGLVRLGRPSIWKYARQAGYRTILIDAWKGEPLYDSERPLVDLTISETDAPTYMRDGVIAEKLAELLKEDAPSFIYVNKFGVHFPYEYSFPSDFHKFPLPLQNRTLAYLLRYREALLDDYSNAILWSVDGFFRTLLNQYDDTNTLLIYTSDHGQSLMDGGQRITHCTTTAQSTQVGEGLVPLFAFTGIAGLDVKLRHSAARAYGHTTHFDIFPTLLLGMGYDEQWIRGHYGPSLLDAPANRRRGFLILSSSGFESFDSMRSLFNGSKWIPVD
jgi:hypothetical protein